MFLKSSLNLLLAHALIATLSPCLLLCCPADPYSIEQNRCKFKINFCSVKILTLNFSTFLINSQITPLVLTHALLAKSSRSSVRLSESSISFRGGCHEHPTPRGKDYCALGKPRNDVNAQTQIGSKKNIIKICRFVDFRYICIDI